MKYSSLLQILLNLWNWLYGIAIHRVTQGITRIDIIIGQFGLEASGNAIGLAIDGHRCVIEMDS